MPGENNSKIRLFKKGTVQTRFIQNTTYIPVFLVLVPTRETYFLNGSILV